MNELALFAGAGGGILGGHLLGWRTVCAVEWEPYPASVLLTRQNERLLPPFPIWDDVQTFDGKPWRGIIDVISGGFPCQDISSAGKGAGIEGKRSGMWAHMARIVCEVRPRYVFVENSPMLTSRGLGRVLGDLAALGYDARWGVLGAVHAGAPHKRERIWIVAHAAGEQHEDESPAQRRASEPKLLADAVGDRWKPRGAESARNEGRSSVIIGGSPLADPDSLRELQSEGHESDEWGRTGDGSEAMADTLRNGSQGQREDGDASGQIGLCSRARSDQIKHLRHSAGAGLPFGINGKVGQSGSVTQSQRSDWWKSEPDVGRVANGVAARVDRLKAIGNGQVPAVAALAWNLLD